MEGLYKTDAAHQFQDSIEFLLKQTTEYLDNPTNIKWIVIAFQNALQCTCVFYLDGNDTTQTAALRTKSAKKWFDWIRDNDKEKPKSFLASPNELFKRCLKKDERALSPLAVSTQRLINLRNNFAHFYPTSLLVELSGFKKSC